MSADGNYPNVDSGVGDHEPGSLTGAARPLCAYCGSDEHLGPECPTLTAGGDTRPDEAAEGTR